MRKISEEELSLPMAASSGGPSEASDMPELTEDLEVHSPIPSPSQKKRGRPNSLPQASIDPDALLGIPGKKPSSPPLLRRTGPNDVDAQGLDVSNKPHDGTLPKPTDTPSAAAVAASVQTPTREQLQGPEVPMPPVKQPAGDASGNVTAAAVVDGSGNATAATLASSGEIDERDRADDKHDSVDSPARAQREFPEIALESPAARGSSAQHRVSVTSRSSESCPKTAEARAAQPVATEPKPAPPQAAAPTAAAPNVTEQQSTMSSYGQPDESMATADGGDAGHDSGVSAEEQAKADLDMWRRLGLAPPRGDAESTRADAKVLTFDEICDTKRTESNLLQLRQQLYARKDVGESLNEINASLLRVGSSQPRLLPTPTTARSIPGEKGAIELKPLAASPQLSMTVPAKLTAESRPGGRKASQDSRARPPSFAVEAPSLPGSPVVHAAFTSPPRPPARKRPLSASPRPVSASSWPRSGSLQGSPGFGMRASSPCTSPLPPRCGSGEPTNRPSNVRAIVAHAASPIYFAVRVTSLPTRALRTRPLKPIARPLTSSVRPLLLGRSIRMG